MGGWCTFQLDFFLVYDPTVVACWHQCPLQERTFVSLYCLSVRDEDILHASSSLQIPEERTKVCGIVRPKLCSFCCLSYQYILSYFYSNFLSISRLLDCKEPGPVSPSKHESTKFAIGPRMHPILCIYFVWLALRLVCSLCCGFDMYLIRSCHWS